MTTYLQASVSTYKSLQSFTSIEQLNESIGLAFKNFKSFMTKTSMRVLALISKYSIKYLGVSYLANSTIAEELEVDVRTVRRSFRQLEELGLVESYRLKRKSGDRRETSSAVVIVPLISVLNNVPAICPPKEASNKQNINNTNETRDSSTEQILKEHLLNKLPAVVAKSLAPFFDAATIYQLAGTIFKAKAKVDASIQFEDHYEKYYDAIRSVIMAYKFGKVKSLERVMFESVRKITHKISMIKQFEDIWGIQV